MTAKLRTLKAQIASTQKGRQHMETIVDQASEQQESLVQTILKNNQLRYKIDDQLRQLKFTCDQSQNLTIQNEAKEMILQESIRFLTETNDRLFRVIENLAFDKKAGDLLRFEMN